jgi:hypothetical protein
MQTVPLQPIPNQTLQVSLGGQPCILNVYQLAYGMFMDIYVGNTLIVAGVVCQNLNRIVRSVYLGFIGDFCFFDTQGSQDPVFTGLGARYQLVYLAEADLPAGEG